MNCFSLNICDVFFFFYSRDVRNKNMNWMNKTFNESLTRRICAKKQKRKKTVHDLMTTDWGLPSSSHENLLVKVCVYLEHSELGQ